MPSKFISILLLLLGLVFTGFGQELPPLDIDTISTSDYHYWKPKYYDSIPASVGWEGKPEDSYEQMVKRYHSKDFEYVESISDKLNFMDSLIARVHRFFQRLLPNRTYEFDRTLYTILAVIGGVIFLILMYKLFFSGKKVFVQLPEEEGGTEDQIAFVERNLMQVDLRQYIQDALSKRNYAVAVRYQQLYNIQLLHEKGVIEWKHTKTNMELIEGVDNIDLRRDFLYCASIYDHVWFGDFVITQQDYQRYEKIFEQFQQHWK